MEEEIIKEVFEYWEKKGVITTDILQKTGKEFFTSFWLGYSEEESELKKGLLIAIKKAKQQGREEERERIMHICNQISYKEMEGTEEENYIIDLFELLDELKTQKEE